jgi:hypothetical protein
MIKKILLSSLVLGFMVVLPATGVERSLNNGSSSNQSERGNATALSSQDQQTIKLAQAVMGSILPEKDVHEYTRPLGDQYPGIRNLADKYLPDFTPTDNMQSMDIINEAENELNPNNENSDLTTVFAKIRSYWSNGPDAETKQDLRDVFIRTYRLAKMMDDQGTMLLMVKLALEDNTNTGGGCQPGIVARLIEVYIRNVLEMIQSRYP